MRLLFCPAELWPKAFILTSNMITSRREVVNIFEFILNNLFALSIYLLFAKVASENSAY